MTEQETQEKKSNLAQANLGRDLLKAMVDVIRTAQKPWHAISQAEQEQLIDRLRDETDDMVRKAINTLLTGEFPAVGGKVHQVVFSGGIKCTLIIDALAKYRHELADAEGTNVLVVVADPAEYLQSMDQVKADADQPDMFEPTGEPEPLNLPPMQDGGDDVVEGEDGLPEGLEDDAAPPEPPPIAAEHVLADTDPDPAEEPDAAEDEPPPANNEATLVEPEVLRENLGKIQIDVPLAIIDGWQASERLTALRFATSFWEAVQLEDQPPQPPFFLLPYTPNG